MKPLHAPWALIIAASLFACGSGGSSPANDGIEILAQTARVSVLMSEDSPENGNGAYITFTKIALVPDDGGDPVTIFESAEGKEVNFSLLATDDLLFSVDDDVSADIYSKILVAVKSIRIEGGVCEDLSASVPDDEIELVPDEEIEIKPGDRILIRLAMDSERSVQIKVDSENGECVFQPVVNVQVHALSTPTAQDCPASVEGEVTDLELNIALEVIGFVLDLGGEDGTQKVLLDEETGLFGENGLPVEVADIRIGDEVVAKGRLNDDGDLLADVLIAGEAIAFRGTILEGPDRDGRMSVKADEGGAVVGETTVQLFRGTSILFDCQDATADSLVEGQRVTVTGKVAPSDSIFRAAEVAIDPVVILGALTGVEDATDGREISVRPVGVAVESTVFVPDEVGIQLEGDGEIPANLLAELLECEPLPVRVLLADDDDETDPPTATEVRVGAEEVEGEVTAIDASNRLVTVDETLVELLRTATIIDLRDDEELGSLADVEAGDHVRVFGLEACDEDDVGFYGFVMLILDKEPDRPLPPDPERYEGCGVGFWKNHPEEWPAGYGPETLFDDVFEQTFPGMSLMDVLRQGGGGLHSLGRHTVAALLNAASDSVTYRFTEDEVIDQFDETAPNGPVNLLKERFEYWNERGCPVDGHDDEDDDRKEDDRGEDDP